MAKSSVVRGIISHVAAQRDEVAAALAAGLRSNRDDRLDRAIEQAVRLGPVGDELLTEALRTARGFSRVLVIVALGDVEGPAGAAALREMLDVTGSGSRDLRCAALSALGKREGERATPEMLYCLRSRDGVVRDCAVQTLAKAGDDRGWNQVLDWLTEKVKAADRPMWLAGSPILLAVSYLVRHAPTGSPRLSQLVEAVRSAWPRLVDDERAWLATNWPDVLHGGPDPTALAQPDPGRIQTAAAGLLFGMSVVWPGES